MFKNLFKSKYLPLFPLLVCFVAVGVYFSPRILQNLKSDIVAAPHVTLPPSPYEVARNIFNEKFTQLENELLSLSNEWNEFIEVDKAKTAQINAKYYDGINGDIIRQQKLIDIAQQELNELRSFPLTPLGGAGNEVENEIQKKENAIKRMEKTKETYEKEYETETKNESNVFEKKWYEFLNKKIENEKSKVKAFIIFRDATKSPELPGQTDQMAPLTSSGMTGSTIDNPTPGNLTPETQRRQPYPSVNDLKQLGPNT